jgi:nucleotide-binding universal stress UspA family protein
MTKLYKLTDEQGRTRAREDNELTWTVGVEHRTACKGTRLCTADVIHAYEHPLIAVLMNPVHADFNPNTMRLFVAEGEIVAREGQLKCGVHALKIVEEIPVPALTTEQRVKFAILCAKLVCKDAAWNAWADKWLSSEDRSEEEAKAAWAAAEAQAAAADTKLDLIHIIEQI